MTERARHVDDLYRRYRLSHQVRYYRDRAVEFRVARNEARLTAAVFLVLASLAGALGGADVLHWRLWWAVAATALGALATALTSYEAVIGFDRNSREYERTVAALARVEAAFPGNAGADDLSDAEVAAQIAKIESVLVGEVDRWAKSSAPQPDSVTETDDSSG